MFELRFEMLNSLWQGNEVSCSYFQWYDPDPKLRSTDSRDPNNSEVSSTWSRRGSKSYREVANRVEKVDMNEEANGLERCYRDGDQIWKCMVFLLVGVLLGMWLK